MIETKKFQHQKIKPQLKKTVETHQNTLHCTKSLQYYSHAFKHI